MNKRTFFVSVIVGAACCGTARADGFLRAAINLDFGVAVPADLGLVRDVATVGGHHYAILGDGSIRWWGWSGGVVVPEPPIRPGFGAVRIQSSGGCGYNWTGGYGSLVVTYSDGLMMATKTGYDNAVFPSDQPFRVDGLVKLVQNFGARWVGLFANGELRTVFSGADEVLATDVEDISADRLGRVIYRTRSNQILPLWWHHMDSNGCIDFVNWPPCGDLYDWYPFTSQNCLPPPTSLGPVAKMTCGWNRIIVVRPDGTAQGWGYNHLGQCEFPRTLGAIRDVRCEGDGNGGNSNILLLQDGSVISWPLDYGVTSVGLGTVTQFADEECSIVFSDLPRPACVGDLAGYDPANFVQRVDGEDLGVLLANWGSQPALAAADLNDDGTVDGADLGILLSRWGDCPR